MLINAESFRLYGLATVAFLCLLSFRLVFLAILWGVVPTLLGLMYFAIRTSFEDIEPPKLKQLEFPKRPDPIPTNHSWHDSEFSLNHPDIAKLIEDITDLIIQNYIMSWFQHLNMEKSSAFPQCAKTTLLQSVVQFQKALVRVDEGNLIFLKLLPLFTRHFETFRVSKQAVESGLLLERNTALNFDFQVAVEFNKNYKLHRALSLRKSRLDRDIEKYVAAKVERVLPYIIDEKELSSPYVSILVRDILASSVISPLIIKVSDADFWNMSLISISEKILEEQDQVHEIRRILSKEVEDQQKDMPSETERSTIQIEQDLYPGISGKQFEDYLRQISLLSSFKMLQRVRYSLIIKLLQLRTQDNLSKSLLEYRKRLLLSLNLLQTRFKHVDSRNRYERPQRLQLDFSDAEKAVDEFEAFLDTITLSDILKEQCGLLYFERYLSLPSKERGLTYLRFWKIAEEMKNPLEDASEEINVSISPSEVSKLRDSASNFFQGEQLEYMKFLDPGLVTNIVLFTKSLSCDDNLTFSLARRSMLLLQAEAQKTLNERFFPSFKTSKEFLDLVSHSQFANTEMYARTSKPTPADSSFPNRGTRHLSAIRVFSSPDIDVALESIMKKNSSERKRRYSRATLFGNEGTNRELFEDGIFEENDETNDSFCSILRSSDEGDMSDSLSFRRDNLQGQHHNFSKDTDGFASLKNDIAELSISVDQIERELELLNHLILKAELTNNRSQLKLLKKSQRVLIKDLDNKELLKQQLMVQENANSLFKKTKVAIKSYFVDTHNKHSGEVIYYLINVDHFYNGEMTAWEIPRRFSEFYRLNCYLKRRYKNQLRKIQGKDVFPKKVKMSLKYHVSKSLLYEERKSELENYLKELLSIPEICQDGMFRKFLTDLSSFNIRATVTESESLDEQEQNPPLENSISSLRSSKEGTPQKNPSVDFPIKQVNPSYGEELSFYDDERNFYEINEGNINVQDRSFVKAICDFFISIFSLNSTNAGWLRGRAIITVLQQLLGSAIEKYIKDSIKRLRSEAQICDILDRVKQSLGSTSGDSIKRSDPKPKRTKGELKRTQTDSYMMLQCLFIEICGKVVGLRSAQEAAAHLHEMLQNSYLNANLLLEVLDLIFDEVILGNKLKKEEPC